MKLCISGSFCLLFRCKVNITLLDTYPNSSIWSVTPSTPHACQLTDDHNTLSFPSEYSQRYLVYLVILFTCYTSVSPPGMGLRPYPASLSCDARVWASAQCTKVLREYICDEWRTGHSGCKLAHLDPCGAPSRAAHCENSQRRRDGESMGKPRCAQNLVKGTENIRR